MIKTTILTGALAALLIGAAIAVQSTISSRAGSLVGEIRTGILTNLMGGITALVLLLVLLLSRGGDYWRVPRMVIGMTALSGFLGVLIVTGISFSLQRAGIAAGLAAVILGQLALSFVIDTAGMGGVEPIPLSASRILGLLITGLGVFLLLPKS